MSSVEVQIADIERELLALTGNQPPNPRQIGTFRVDRTTTVNNEEKTIVFDDGVPKFVRAYLISGFAFVSILTDSGDLKVVVGGDAPVDYAVVSVGAFSLV